METVNSKENGQSGGLGKGDAAQTRDDVGSAPPAPESKFVVVQRRLVEGSVTYVTFSIQDKRLAPFRAENHTVDKTIFFKQDGCARVYALPPRSRVPFAFEEPLAPHRLHVVLPEFRTHFVLESVERISSRFGVRTSERLPLLDAEIGADGPTRVVRFYDAALARPSRHSAPREERAARDTPLAKYVVRVPRLGVSLVDQKPQEVVYVTLEGVELSRRESAGVQSALELVVHDMQADCQLYNTPFPVALFSRSAEEEEEGGRKSGVAATAAGAGADDFLRVRFSVPREEVHNCAAFNLLDVRVRPVTLNISEDLLVTVLEAAEALHLAGDTGGTAPAADASRLVYFKKLYVSEVLVNVSFDSAPTRSAEPHEHSRMLETLLKYPLFALRVENATIRLGELVLRHPLMQRSELVAKVAAHYAHLVRVQLFRLLGSFDIIGSPVLLAESLSEGVRSIANESYTIDQKATNLVGHTIYGISNTALKVTNSVTQGMVKLTFDRDFAKARSIARRKKPEGVAQGIAYGFRDMGNDVMSGLIGIVEQPYKEAQKSGGEGFLKGIGKGVVGVVVKPTVGLLDLVSRTTEGLKNAANVGEKRLVLPRRLPRAVTYRRTLEPYDEFKAEGCSILYQLRDGYYVANPEAYLHHTYLLRRKRVLLWSTSHLFLVEREHYSYSMVWRVRLEKLYDRVDERAGSVRIYRQVRKADFRIAQKALDVECEEPHFVAGAVEDMLRHPAVASMLARDDTVVQLGKVQKTMEKAEHRTAKETGQKK